MPNYAITSHMTKLYENVFDFKEGAGFIQVIDSFSIKSNGYGPANITRAVGGMSHVHKLHNIPYTPNMM